MALDYRLALDLGTNSIGWCMLRLDMAATPSPTPKAIIRGGVRIFGDGRDPKSGASLAVERRDARAMRRNRDRKLDRKQRVLSALVDAGLLPEARGERRALESLDPYALRAKGLDTALEPYEFGRALFHLNQRRGFQSNRKTDGDEADGSLMKGAIASLRQQLADDGYRTVGEWLAERHTERKGVRARPRGTGKDKSYDLYFDRAMIRHEYDALWDVQQALDPASFGALARESVAAVMFHQRDLLSPKPGRCTFEPAEERAPRALPSVQRLRMYQELNHLAIDAGNFTYTPLTKAQRDVLAHRLERQKAMSFDAMRKALKLAGAPAFNLEGAKHNDLKGNATSYLLASADRFGEAWHEIPLDGQDDVVERILGEQDEEKLVAWLSEHHGLDQEHAESVSAARTALTKVAEGYSRLSRAATARILPHLIANVVTYDVAVGLAGYPSHSGLTLAEQSGEVLPALPYYGEYLQRHVGYGSGDPGDLPAERFGRISNPTVHIALNEVRKVVNSLIDEYGPPAQVAIEVTRNLKLTKERKDEIDKEQAQRQRENERLKAEVKEATGIDMSPRDLQKVRLWIELNPSDASNRRCPYTGQQIGIARLFSSEVEIEHILPFSMTLDDSLNNKTVSMISANHVKGNRTPYDAFGHSPDGYAYADILERAHHMPKGKGYRFGPDGYARWLGRQDSFLARALNDTAYLSRIAREYLDLICPGEVWAVPGTLTGHLRWHWGLNGILAESKAKNRADHRHHAIDAVVIGCMDRSSLQRFATQSARGKNLAAQVNESPNEPPIPGLRERVQHLADSIIVSHRPNHGHQRQMNNDTNYGLRAGGFVALRRPLDSFASVDAIDNAHFSDPVLKTRLLKHLGDATGDEFKERLASFTAEHGTRRARIMEKLATIPIPLNPKAAHRAPARSKARADQAVRGVKGDANYCIEISIGDHGQWQGEVISTYEAYRIAAEHGTDRLRDPNLTQSGLPLVMRLMRDDTVSMDIDGRRRLYRLCKFGTSGAMFFAGLNEANVDARVRVKELDYLRKMASTLEKAAAHPVTVSPSGRAKAARRRA
jgi:CRISPR-associated endonuclease Csn1